MLFNFPELVKKHNIKFKGLIHVGAHDCSEVILYGNEGIENVALIEANPFRCGRLAQVLEQDQFIATSYPFSTANIPDSLIKIIRKYSLYNYIMCDKHGEKMKLNITNFDGGLDSILKLNETGVKTSWAPFAKIGEVEVDTATLDILFIDTFKNHEKYNFLNIDVEGAELMVLKGGDRLLKTIDYVLLETQEMHRFDGSCLHHEIVEFLEPYGFVQVDYFDTGKGWGDALFVK